MGLWSYYFFAKFFLYGGGFIDFHIVANLVFAALLVLPLRKRWLMLTRRVLAVPAGLALLYYDSWLPPIQRTLSQAHNLQQFNGAYLLELLGRFVNPTVIAALLGMSLLLFVASRRLRLSSFVFVGIAAIGLVDLHTRLRQQAPATVTTANAGSTLPSSGVPGDAQLNAHLQQFYQSEAARRVNLPVANLDDTPFDIVFIHICSLAWDDMDLVGLKDHPLMSQFDIVFRQFNTAASYSGPAAIRLLRGTCGQPRHEDLYKPAEGCNLFAQLQASGYQPEWLMNHDGHFGDFTVDVHDRGGMPTKPDDNTQAKIGLRSFDDTPIYDDADLWTRWLQKRSSDPSPRVALYYNTISLHDGNHVPGEAKRSINDSYRLRLNRLFEGMQGFFAQLAKSGRRTVVIMVPEHGAALRGDRMQISGLREIPTPAITLAPAAVKLVGFDTANTTPLYVDAPSSYLALSTLIGQLIAHDPFGASHPPLADYVQDLPQTPFVAENEGQVLMRVNGYDLLRNPDLSWAQYRP